jgi:hypothetical protein
MTIQFSHTTCPSGLLQDLVKLSDLQSSFAGRCGDDGLIIETPKQIAENVVCKVLKPHVEHTFDWELIEKKVAPLIGVPLVRMTCDFGTYGTRTVIASERLIPMPDVMERVLKEANDTDYAYDAIHELFRMKAHATLLLFEKEQLLCDHDPSNFGFDPISNSVRLFDYGHLISRSAPDVPIDNKDLLSTALRNTGLTQRYLLLKQIDLFRIDALPQPPESVIDIHKLKLQLFEGIRNLWKSYEAAMNHSMGTEDAQSIGVLGEFNYQERLKKLHANLLPHMNTLHDTLLQQVRQGII